jgi:hypothetical protein
VKEAALQCLGLASASLRTAAAVHLHLGDAKQVMARNEVVPDHSLDAVLVDVFDTEGNEPNCITNVDWAHLVKTKLKDWHREEEGACSAATMSDAALPQEACPDADLTRQQQRGGGVVVVNTWMKGLPLRRLISTYLQSFHYGWLGRSPGLGNTILVFQDGVATPPTQQEVHALLVGVGVGSSAVPAAAARGMMALPPSVSRWWRSAQFALVNSTGGAGSAANGAAAGRGGTAASPFTAADRPCGSFPGGPWA